MPQLPCSRIVTLLTAILIIKVILSGYPNYFPTNFNADFLLGRERYFWGYYSWRSMSISFPAPLPCSWECFFSAHR